MTHTINSETGEVFEVNVEQLRKPFPADAIMQREGGRGKMLSYVEGHTVILRLIEATHNRFDIAVRGIQWREGLGKNKDQSLCMATVALSIPGLGTREALGVQLVSPLGGEDLVKGAVTDGIKKAATLFGVGLELYGEFYEQPIQRISASEHSAFWQVAMEHTWTEQEVAALIASPKWGGFDSTEDITTDWYNELLTKALPNTKLHTKVHQSLQTRTPINVANGEAARESIINDPVGDGQGPVEQTRATSQASATITYQQIKRMMAIAKEHEWTEDGFKLLIAHPKVGGFASRTDITKDRYDDICERYLPDPQFRERFCGAAMQTTTMPAPEPEGAEAA